MLLARIQTPLSRGGCWNSPCRSIWIILASWPCKHNIVATYRQLQLTQQDQWVMIISPTLQKRDWIVPGFFIAREIIDIQDHLYFGSQSGVISCALCRWYEISQSHSQRLNSQVTHITDIYLAVGRHNLKVDEPIHHWSEPFLSPVPSSYCQKQVNQAIKPDRCFCFFFNYYFCMFQNINH